MPVVRGGRIAGRTFFHRGQAVRPEDFVPMDSLDDDARLRPNNEFTNINTADIHLRLNLEVVLMAGF